MRIVLITLLLGCMTGCGDDTSSGGDMTAVADMTMMIHDLSGADLVTATCGDLGAAAFGATCTSDCDCMSLMCRQFAMGAKHLCTKPCTVATQATDCPAPSAGTCTPNLYCRFN